MTAPERPLTAAGRALLAPPCTCGFIESYDYYHLPECRSRRGVQLVDILAIEAEARAECDALRAALERTRRYVQNNLDVWSEDEATNIVSYAACDLFRKMLNVIDTGNPLRTALAGSPDE